MSKGAYIGVEGLARKVKDIYIGVDGVARRVKKGYVGVGGVARLFYDTTSKIIRNGSISLYTTLPYKAGYMAVALFEQYDYFYFLGGQTAYSTGTSDTGVATFSNQGKDIALMYPSLPAANYGMAYATVGSKVYMFGGAKDSSLIVFDDDTLRMSKRSDLWDVAYTTAVAVGAKVYLFGGGVVGSSRYVKNVFVYDTEKETLSEIPDTPYQYGCDIAAAAVGAKVYLFGGLNGDTWEEYDSIYVFDTEDETVTMLSTKLPTAARAIAAAAVGTKVYLFGGKYTDSDGNRVVKDSIYVFDTEDETITMLSTKLPTAAWAIAAAAVGTKVYLFGGSSNFGTVNGWLDTVYQFNTEG